jgi:signal transduction histidine kinase
LLAAHLPALFVFGLFLRWPPLITAAILIPPMIFLLLGHQVRERRPASVFITAGLTYCSATLVVLAHGSIEAHFHFFILIGFIALYQDWVPFIWMVGFTVLSHGLGSAWRNDLIFGLSAGQRNPWLWSGIHGAAVLAACAGMVVFWRVSEDTQDERARLVTRLAGADAEAERRRFSSDLLVNLARRNQSMLYRQLDIINQLEEKERDPDALAELFRLDHLATRVRRNAESLLVLSGEQPARTWGAPIALHQIVRAAVAETEDLERVGLTVDETVAVTGRSVTDLTHLLAELTENAVRFSPPEASVTIRSRAQVGAGGTHLITIEDWGLGISTERLAKYNTLLANPPEVDVGVPQQLGFHVVGRLAARHGVGVTLTPTAGGGLTAAIVLPASLIDQRHSSTLRPRSGLEQLTRPASNGHSHSHHNGRHSARDGAQHRSVATAEPRTAGLVVPDQPGVPPIEMHQRPAAVRTVADLFGADPDGSEPGFRGGWRGPEDFPAPSPDARPRAENDEPAVAPALSATPSAEEPADRSGADDALPRLRRRSPQTHLSPELRIPEGKPTPTPRPRPPRPGPTAEHRSEAANALSRYQANRHVAQEQQRNDALDQHRHDEGRTEQARPPESTDHGSRT